jgi:superfamily II DNA or RNA helicase
MNAVVQIDHLTDHLVEVIAGLDRKTIVGLWRDFELHERIRPATGVPGTVLAREMVGYFDTQALAQKDIRNALLRCYDKPSSKLVKADPDVSKKMKDWPTRLYPVWRQGGAKARAFCEAFGLDSKYAGEAALEKPAAVEELSPRPVIHPLMGFQQDLADQIVRDVRQAEPCRILASIPTGAGKTRVAMDAIMRLQAELGGIVLWLATTAELCEQAASAYKSVYEDQPRSFGGHLHRFWGTYELDPDFASGMLVASIQKLRGFLDAKGKAQKETQKKLKDAVSLVVFDEAHHVVARTYKQTVRQLVGTPGARTKPLVGLTATPGRGFDPDGSALSALVREFGADLKVPSQLKKSKNPVKRLQTMKVLARIDSAPLQGELFQLEKGEQSHIEQFAEYPPGLLERVGRSDTRNARIIRNVTLAPKSQSTLVFACSVRQAEQLAYLWRSKGVAARAIAANTHPSLRRRWIAEFASGDLQVLVNFGVLTTGFDAPRVKKVIMARPTISPILFEQMIGRGLRGPLFGGTEICKVVDVVDSFKFHGEPKGFKKFEIAWMKGKHTQG